MEFRLLGPLEALDGGNPIPLGGPKQRTVLVHLLLRPEQLVPADRLIDELWGEEPPDAARNVLQTYVSHLRNALGRDRLEGRSRGYVLRVDRSEIDAFRFEALVEKARKLTATDAAAAVRLYGDALALWRAPALDDLADQPSLRTEITRLGELRMAATEERLDAELELGRHAELIPELEVLVARDPLRERSWGHLMTALYRSGRQGEALATFQRAREVLAQELGIDPSSELQRLHEQILRQDPVLEIGGEPLRGYRLLEQVGEGAFGAVHRAFQPQVGREVAVKVIHPRLAGNPEFIRRFEAEAQIVARLEHPHIVPLYDYWREPDSAYLVMRFLRGGSLREALREGPLAPETAVAILDQVAKALASAHHQGVVHRDVKPANILFDEEGNAYLSDFGIAKELAAAPSSTRGETPSPFAYYLSPEEVRAEAPSPRTDIYSLGLVLYEMLAGRHAYAGSPPQTLPEKHLREPVPSLRSARADIPTSVDGVIERATAKDPVGRFADARVFASSLRAALGPAAAAASVPAVQVRNPYKGLRPFLEADAADFFGREDLVDRLVTRMTEGSEGSRLLAVVGPSGSGKSSLVRAGLLPALRRGAVPGSEGWFVAQMVPGNEPFAELEGALLRVAAQSPSPDLVDQIERDQDGLIRAAGWVLPDDGSELLLVIDQFEELFTLVDDDDRRVRFLASVVAAATNPRSRVRFVINIRADFYDRPLLYRTLAELVRARTEVVVPLTTEELERAVAGPAERVGVSVAPGLVAQLVADVADQPGALPLLQFALTELFDRRQGSTLSPEIYREIGGVSGALARRAEEIFSSLSEEGREVARQLFLRLVTPGEGAEDTRRRVLRVELASIHAGPAGVETVIDRFGEARLLSFDRDPDTRGPTVEVAHEALLREWDRLRGWIDAAREDLRIERRLALAARDWRNSGGDVSFLVSGSRLEQFEALGERSGLAIIPEEREFLRASLAERDRRRAEEEARQARERAQERRSFRRLRSLVAVLAAAVLIAAGLTVLTINQRERAERESRVAVARELAAAAVASLDEDAERGILLALEAVDQTRSVDGSVLPEAEEALHRAVLASRIALRVPGVGGALDWSPDGRIFVTEGPEESGVVDIRDAETGESVRRFPGHRNDVNIVAFSDDGSMLATAGDDGAARVWDPATGEELWTFRGPDPNGEVWGPSFSPDGSLLATSWPDEGMVRMWDLATGRMIREIGPWEVNYVTSFSPDGRRLAIATWDSGAVVVDVRSGRQAFALRGQEFGVRDVDWSPDGRWIATSSSDSTVRLWDAETGNPRYTLFGHAGEVVAADWSSDSARLVTGSNDGTAKLWEITRVGARELLSLPAQDGGGGIWVAFSPDGDRVMTGDQQITAVKSWDVSLGGDAEWAILPADSRDLGGVVFTRDGRRVIASNGDGSVTLWDAETGEASMTIGRAGPSALAVLAIDVSPDGELIATTGRTAKVWEAGTGEEVLAVRSGGGVEDVAWSPDGQFLATVNDRGVTRIVDRSGQEVIVLREEPGFRLSAVSFSPDGRLLATARVPTERVDPTVAAMTIWDWEQGRVVRRISVWAEGLYFDPSGAHIATAGVLGLGEIWDVESGRKMATLAGHKGAVNEVAFNPEGSVIATASTDGTVRLWDPESGVQVLALRGHETAVWDLAFSPDGSKLASASPDGTVRVWALDLDDLIEIARRELTRAFTVEECRQYLHLARCPRV